MLRTSFAVTRHFLLTLLLVPLLGGCSSILDLEFGDERNHERALQRWHSARAYEYEITVDRRCDCLYTGPVRLLVRGGVPVAGVERYSGLPVSWSVLRYYPSVEELFTLIEDARRDRSVDVEVTYDHTYGYPRVTNVDYDWFSRHDDLRYDLSELRILR